MGKKHLLGYNDKASVLDARKHAAHVRLSGFIFHQNCVNSPKKSLVSLTTSVSLYDTLIFIFIGKKKQYPFLQTKRE